MVVNDKEKESVFNEPRDDKPTDSGSSHKKRDGKKKRRIKNIIYYDSDASSSSPHDDNNDSLSKKKTVVGGLRLSKVLKNLTNMLSKYNMLLQRPSNLAWNCTQ
jgi:hypothetical protein